MQNNFIFSPQLNVYDALLLMTAGLALVLAIPILLKRDRLPSDILLAVFVLSQGVFSFHNVMLYNAFIGPSTVSLLFPFQTTPHLVIMGFQGLLLYWYAQAMMGNRVNFATPLTLIGVLAMLCMAVINVYANVQLVTHKMTMMACYWFPSIFSVAVGWYTLIQLKNYDDCLPLTHSNLDRHNLSWLRIIALGFVAVWTLQLMALMFGIFGFKPQAIALSTFNNLPPLLLIGAMTVYSQTHAISRPINTREADTKDPVEEGIGYTVNPDLPYKLDDLMLRVKVYQDPELRLEGLADSMGISPRSLSTLLNRHYKKSFYDLVNHYRVLDAQEQLSSPDNKNKSIQRVFEDAGFNSKTTFNTLFKKYTGQTPSEFRHRAAEYQAQPS